MNICLPWHRLENSGIWWTTFSLRFHSFNALLLIC